MPGMGAKPPHFVQDRFRFFPGLFRRFGEPIDPGAFSAIVFPIIPSDPVSKLVKKRFHSGPWQSGIPSQDKSLSSSLISC